MQRLLVLMLCLAAIAARAGLEPTDEETAACLSEAASLSPSPTETPAPDCVDEPEPPIVQIPPPEIIVLPTLIPADIKTTGRLVQDGDPILSAAEERALGAQKEKEGFDAEALAAYERATEKEPGDYLNWKALGKLNYRLENKTAAIRAFEKVQVLKPTPEFRAWLDKYRIDN